MALMTAPEKPMMLGDGTQVTERNEKKAHTLGLTSATGLVIGSIVGTGVFTMPAAELRAMGFPEGSMGPKVQAACDFVEGGGRRAIIGRLADAGALLAGTAGTTVTAV
jgi:acetylglutamate kinase